MGGERTVAPEAERPGVSAPPPIWLKSAGVNLAQGSEGSGRHEPLGGRAKGSGRPLGRAGSGQIGWSRGSGFGLVAHAVAGPFDDEGLGVMQQAVKQS